MSVGPYGSAAAAAVHGNGDWAGARDLVERPNACIRTSRGEPLGSLVGATAQTRWNSLRRWATAAGRGELWPSIRVSKGLDAAGDCDTGGDDLSKSRTAKRLHENACVRGRRAQFSEGYETCLPVAKPSPPTKVPPQPGRQHAAWSSRSMTERTKGSQHERHIETERDHAEAVALFRASVIGSLGCRDMSRGELANELRSLSKNRFRPPGVRR